jgi:hypothetical protein
MAEYSGGIDAVDYCGVCGTVTVTPWNDDECGCCGRQWGYDTTVTGSVPQCRGIHIIGDVWRRLLDS